MSSGRIYRTYASDHILLRPASRHHNASHHLNLTFTLSRDSGKPRNLRQISRRREARLSRETMNPGVAKKSATLARRVADATVGESRAKWINRKKRRIFFQPSPRASGFGTNRTRIRRSCVATRPDKGCNYSLRTWTRDEETAGEIIRRVDPPTKTLARYEILAFSFPDLPFLPFILSHLVPHISRLALSRASLSIKYNYLDSVQHFILFRSQYTFNS